ncbi:MAG: hypothetical protein ACKOGJ_01840, partial [Phycisphaerales bacterium]
MPEDPFSQSLVMEGGTADADVGTMRGPAAVVSTRPLAAASAPRWVVVPMAIRNVAGVSFIGIDRVDVDDRTCVARTERPDGENGSSDQRTLSDAASGAQPATAAASSEVGTR